VSTVGPLSPTEPSVGPQPAVATVRRAVRASLSDLEHGCLVLVACSGGPDSLALAAATAYEAPRRGLRAGAVTVDHDLQPGSRERAAAVSQVLTGLGLDPVEVVTVAVAGRGAGSGPEAAARKARYLALDQAAERHEAVAVLIGHSRDDQAETVLLGLARGSGARSLSGMAAVAGRYRRPFLHLSRAVVREACLDLGLQPWDDPHNADPTFTRVRVRRDALPALEKALGPGVAAALARSARLLRDDADALDAWAEQAALSCAGALPASLRAEPLRALPAAVRRRVLRGAALSAGCRPTELTAVHVEEMERLVTHWHGQGPLHLPGGVRAVRADGLVRLDAVAR